jgi:hypothetical protein
MITPSVTNTARRTILNRKREEKNAVAAIMRKKRTSERIFSGGNVLPNHPKTLKPHIPKINHNIFRFGLPMTSV